MEDRDFWEVYPDAALIDCVKQLRDKQPEKAGAIMWYIFYMNDPSNEFVSKLPEKERAEELKKVLGVAEKDIKYKYVQKVEEWFERNWLDRPRKFLRLMYKKYDEAHAVAEMHTIETPEDIALYNTILDGFSLMKTQLDKAEALFQESKSNKTKYGGGDISAADSGELFT